MAALSLGSPSVMSFRPKYGKTGQFSTYLKASTAVNRKKYPRVLEVPMRHGDMMVMHGKDIQRYYEVCSTVLGSFHVVGELELTLTARGCPRWGETLLHDLQDD